MPFPLVVLDASAALALLLAEKEGDGIAALLEGTIKDNGQIFVPGVFWYELGNGMLTAERRNRMSRQEVTAAERYFSRLPIVAHAPSDHEGRQSIYELARKHELSFYDASYLELALRHQASLASCDAHLTSLKKRYPQVFPGAGSRPEPGHAPKRR